MQELIERLEKATGPDRGTDCKIWLALNDKQIMTYGGGYGLNARAPEYKSAREIWPDSWPHWGDRLEVEAVSMSLDAPNYTGSIDAALTLVPEGWRLEWCGQDPSSFWFFELIERNGPGLTDRAWSKHPAIALCIAAIKARTSLTQPQRTNP